MAPHQQPRWTARAEGLTWGGLGAAPLRTAVDRLRRTQAAQRQAQQVGGLIVAQTPMTGSDPLTATDYITEAGRWIVTAHATVRTTTTATGRLECGIADIGHWPAGPSPEVDVDLGGGRPAVGFAHASFIALADGGSPILVGGSYYPSSGDIDEAWLVWRAHRLT